MFTTSGRSLPGNLAEGFGNAARRKLVVEEVNVHPQEYYHSLLDPNFYNLIDRETELRLIASGVVGYFWGAVIKFGLDLGPGQVRFHTKDASEAEYLLPPPNDGTGEDFPF